MHTHASKHMPGSQRAMRTACCARSPTCPRKSSSKRKSSRSCVYGSALQMLLHSRLFSSIFQSSVSVLQESSKELQVHVTALLSVWYHYHSSIMIWFRQSCVRCWHWLRVCATGIVEAPLRKQPSFDYGSWAPPARGRFSQFLSEGSNFGKKVMAPYETTPYVCRSRSAVSHWLRAADNSRPKRLPAQRYLATVRMSLRTLVPLEIKEDPRQQKVRTAACFLLFCHFCHFGTLSRRLVCALSTLHFL